MTKRYIDTAFIYAMIAMILGVFYREFTKLRGFAGQTTLSVMHTHYFVLGMLFFLLLALLEQAFSFSAQKHTSKAIWLYHIGLNMTGATLLTRGLTQVLAVDLSKGMDASISGVAGIGHIVLGIGLVLWFLQLKKQAAALTQ